MQTYKLPKKNRKSSISKEDEKRVRIETRIRTRQMLDLPLSSADRKYLATI